MESSKKNVVGAEAAITSTCIRNLKICLLNGYGPDEA